MELWLLLIPAVFIGVLAFALYWRAGIEYHTSREIKALDAAKLAEIHRDFTEFEKEMIRALNAEVEAKEDIDKKIKSASSEKKKQLLERVKAIANRLLKYESELSVQMEKVKRRPASEIINLLEKLKAWVRWQGRALRSLS